MRHSLNEFTASILQRARGAQWEYALVGIIHRESELQTFGAHHNLMHIEWRKIKLFTLDLYRRGRL